MSLEFLAFPFGFKKPVTALTIVSMIKRRRGTGKEQENGAEVLLEETKLSRSK